MIAGIGRCALPLAFIYALAIGSAAKADGDSREFQLGEKCLQGKLFTNAVKHFNEAIRAEPNNVKYHYERALATLELKDKDGALADFQFCKKAAPSMQIAPKYWAAAYRAAGEYPKSIEQWTAAIKLEPKDAELYYGRAQTYIEHEQYDKAIDDYSSDIKLRPREDRYYSERAQCYAQQKQYAKAIADYNQTLKANPENNGIFIRRALCYLELAQYKEALADYTKAVSIKPNEPKAYAMRAKAYERMGLKKEAEVDRNKARELGEDFNL